MSRNQSSDLIQDIDNHVKNRTYDFVHMNTYNPANIKSTFITIVMTTHNRREQTLQTLRSFTQSSKHDKITVILVDDSTERYLDEKELEFPFQITYITIENSKKSWINPCVNYNIGFNEIKTNQVIIQNAEVCHVGDVIDYVSNNLSSRNYLVFDVCALPSKQSNESFNRVDNDNKYDATIQFLATHPHTWYQHTRYRNENWHFLTSITHDNLKKLNGFDNNFALGTCYDDVEFLYRIRNVLKLMILNVVNDIHKVIGIHQWHPTGTNSYNMYYHAINKKVYDNMIKRLKK